MKKIIITLFLLFSQIGFAQISKKQSAGGIEIKNVIEYLFNLATPVNMSGAQLQGADLTNTSFCHGATVLFENCDFTGANFSGSDLTNINFGTSYFTNANLSSVIGQAYCAGSIFINADLSNSDLAATDFTSCDFTGAILNNANMVGVNLSYATMPTNADTKEKFKAIVGAGHWDAASTVWIDSSPIGE